MQPDCPDVTDTPKEQLAEDGLPLDAEVEVLYGPGSKARFVLKEEPTEL